MSQMIDVQMIWEMPGGVHPPENKLQSNQTASQQLPLARQFIVPITEKGGLEKNILVEPGDHVKAGQLIASPVSAMGASIHAPTSGYVEKVDLAPIVHQSGLSEKSIFIEADGKDEWLELNKLVDYQQVKPSELINFISEKGITGMGGAGFPTATKLATESSIDTLIINAVECEPYISCDDVLMREKAREILEGVAILEHIVQPQQIVFAIEDNKPEAIAQIRKSLTQSRLADKVKLSIVPTKYPSGSEKQLIYIVTGKEVPSGKLPSSVGVIMQNVATCFAIKRAVINGEPLIQRLMTITGEGCGQLGNYWVRLGTPIQHVIETTNSDHQHKLIVGGPMMGIEVTDTQSPLTKISNCLIIAGNNELASPEPQLPCIRCGDCQTACPAGLLPQQLLWFSRNNEFQKAEDYHLQDCIECGACSYVCPSNIPLVDYFRYGKTHIRKQKADKLKADQAKQRHERREQRLLQIKLEREAKRKQVALEREQAATQKQQNTNTAQDDKKAAIAAALARVKAKKAQQKDSE